ncbi:MAG: hypothetical protein HYX69_08735 [Planctomycetia bacterium]|nr:hypothetical protein [Planctomycetia bacterium]
MAKKKKAATKKNKAKATKSARGGKKSATRSKSPAAAKSGRRSSWLDEASNTPLIDSYARRLKGFMDALADGKVDENEVREQESRLVALMKEVEPRLDAAMHAKVTQLLCELTAYDLMQILHSMEAARPKTTFRG